MSGRGAWMCCRPTWTSSTMRERPSCCPNRCLTESWKAQPAFLCCSACLRTRWVCKPMGAVLLRLPRVCHLCFWQAAVTVCCRTPWVGGCLHRQAGPQGP